MSASGTLDIQLEQRQPFWCVHLSGNLDALTAPDLKRDVDRLLGSGTEPRLIFDYSKLEFIDSSGVGAVVSLVKRTHALRGEVRMAGLCGQPQEIFRLLRLDHAFPIYPSAEEAAEAQ
jgi:anti-sigma B factor antagonist